MKYKTNSYHTIYMSITLQHYTLILNRLAINLSSQGKLYNAQDICSEIFIFEGRLFMNKHTLKETKKSSNESTIRSLSNADMANMYNMPAMTSLSSVAALAEKTQLNSHSSANKDTTQS